MLRKEKIIVQQTVSRSTFDGLSGRGDEIEN